MGADQFKSFGTGKTIEEAFATARDRAAWDYGHAGYTGTIAEKHEFVMRRTEPMTLDEAYKFVESDMRDNDHDKWGPAWAVPVKDDKSDGWLFYGYASS